MTWLVAAIFCEFLVVALLAPNLGQFHRRIIAKVATALMVPLTMTPAVLVCASIFDPGLTLVEVLRLQVLACGFAVGLGGLATLVGRQWSWGGPIAVSLLGVGVLASPFWGNLLLDLKFESLRSAALEVLVAVNPLFTVAREAI